MFSFEIVGVLFSAPFQNSRLSIVLHAKKLTFDKTINLLAVDPSGIVAGGRAKSISCRRVSRVIISSGVTNKGGAVAVQLEAQAIVMGMSAIGPFHPYIGAGNENLNLVPIA